MQRGERLGEGAGPADVAQIPLTAPCLPPVPLPEPRAKLCSSLLNARRRSRQQPDRWHPKSCRMSPNSKVSERARLAGCDGLWGWFRRQKKGIPSCQERGMVSWHGKSALLVGKDGEQRFLPFDGSGKWLICWVLSCSEVIQEWEAEPGELG